MDIADLRIQILTVLAVIAVLWVMFKVLKMIWKIAFICLVFVGLSFALPAVREWVFGFLRLSSG